MITNRKVLSNIAVCLVGTIVGAQIVACGGKEQTSPLAPSTTTTTTAPDSTTLVIGATALTTRKTGIVQWKVSRIVDGLAANGVDSSGDVITKLVMRGVDNQDGNGVVAELSTDGSIARVTNDSRVLFNEMAPAMFQHLGRDVQIYLAQNASPSMFQHLGSAGHDYQALNGASPSGDPISCGLATATAVAFGVAVVFACVTPAVVVPVVCAGAVAAYLAALQVEYSACSG